MEPHASLAVWSGDRLTIYCSAQMVDSAQHALAATLKMPLEKVEVVSEFIGGGFGGKLSIYADAILAALAAAQLKRPVKVALTRQQMFRVTTPSRRDRPARAAGRRAQDGKLTAIAHEVMTQIRTHGRVHRETAAASTRACMPRPTGCTTPSRRAARPAGRRFDARAGRGVGQLALERPWTSWPTSSASTRSSCGCATSRRGSGEARPVLDRRWSPACSEGAERFGWEQRPPVPGSAAGRPLADRHRHGGGDPAATCCGRRPARVRMDEDRQRHGRMAMTDIGTGTYTILAQVAAETLGLPVEKVTVEIGDSSTIPRRRARAARSARQLRARRYARPASSCKKKLDAGAGPGQSCRPEGQGRARARSSRSTRSTATARTSPRSASTSTPARSGCAACSACSPPAASSTPRPRARS